MVLGQGIGGFGDLRRLANLADQKSRNREPQRVSEREGERERERQRRRQRQGQTERITVFE